MDAEKLAGLMAENEFHSMMQNMIGAENQMFQKVYAQSHSQALHFLKEEVLRFLTAGEESVFSEGMKKIEQRLNGIIANYQQNVINDPAADKDGRNIPQRVQWLGLALGYAFALGKFLTEQQVPIYPNSQELTNIWKLFGEIKNILNSRGLETKFIRQELEACAAQTINDKRTYILKLAHIF